MNEFPAQLTSFDGKESMPVILKRPSILSLAMGGKIPNPLMSAASKLFDFSPKGEEVSLKEIGQVMHIVAEASLVSPAYDEIKDYLTDEQLMEIYHYAKEGADGLTYFRMFRGIHKSSDSGNDHQSTGEQNTSD